MSADTPNNPDRIRNGRFAAGNRLAGNKRGSRHRVTRAIEALFDGESEALARKAIEKALAGDVIALRLCLDRLTPPRRDAPIRLQLPAVRSARDALEASTVLIAALASGKVTPDEAARVMALLATHRELIETADLARQIAEIQARLGE